MVVNLYRCQPSPSDQAQFGAIHVPVSHDYVVFNTLEPLRTFLNPGRYTVTLTYSPRFGRYLPLLNGVVGHSGVRIHSGNTSSDTSGCILIGERDGQSLINSRASLKRFMKLVTFPFTLIIH